MCSGFLRGQVLQSSFNFLWKQGLFCGLCEDLFFQILQDYFGSLSTALVKDCEVKTFPFIPAASSLWQFPSWWVCRQAWRVPRELCWLLHSSISSSMESQPLQYHGLVFALDAPTHLWCSDPVQDNWGIQSSGSEAVNVLLEAWCLSYVFVRLPEWKTTNLKQQEEHEAK